MNEISPIYQRAAEARNISFRHERFGTLSHGSKSHQDFQFDSELLAQFPDGRSAGYLFSDSPTSVETIKADIISFQKAIALQYASSQKVHINLNAPTIFSAEFRDALQETRTALVNFNPENVCLELTEHGGVPDSFSEEWLEYLKEIGFSRALDDFYPFEGGETDLSAERYRLEKIGPHVDAVKFPHHLLKKIAANQPADIDNIFREIENVKRFCNDPFIILEGVKAEHKHLYPVLESLGIHVVQYSGHVGEDRPLQVINNVSSAPSELAYTP